MAAKELKGFTRVINGWNGFWNLWSNAGPAYDRNYKGIRNAIIDLRKH